MKTEVVSAGDQHWLTRAVDTIADGGVVAFPTDTVYGIGSDPFQPDAVARLYQAKGRPIEKAIPILLGSRGDLDRVAKNVPGWVEALLNAFWPGALTLVLEKQASVPSIVSRTRTIGVRIPDHPVALELLQGAGPLAVTSANPSGAREANEPAQVAHLLRGSIDLIIDGGVTPGGHPSTVLDCTRKPPMVLREGPIPPEDIFSLLDRS